MYTPAQSQILDLILASGTLESYGLDPRSEMRTSDKSLRWALLEKPDWRIDVSLEEGEFLIFSWANFAAGKAEPQWYARQHTKVDGQRLAGELKRRVLRILKGDEG